MAVLTLLVGNNKTNTIERFDNIESRLNSVEKYLDKDVKRIETDANNLANKISRIEYEKDQHKKEYMNLYERFLRLNNRPQYRKPSE